VTERWRESRAADFERHLSDLRAGSYEGAAERSDKERIFSRATDLLAPVALRVLSDFNAVMLGGSGEVTDSGIARSPDGQVAREWRISWPGQKRAERRAGPSGPISPLIVRAHFPPGWTHGHLAGSVSGNWPLQITSAADAERQAPILWAIAEAEFHERIFETLNPWDAVPPPLGQGG
jgi:hypothetical protein